MTDFTLTDKHFTHLKGFAAFILENCLREVTEISITIFRQVQLPLLKVLAHLPEQEFHEYIQGLLEDFLTQILEETALEHAKGTLRTWRSDTAPNNPSGDITPADLVLDYHVRKQALLEFVDQYTTDVKEAVAIARELDKFYTEVEKFALGIYVNFKDEEHKALNKKLQEQQLELEDANKAVISSRKELQQTNDTLKEQVKARKQIETTLEKEHTFLQAVLEHIRDGIVACDEEGLLTLFNHATRQFHGIPERSLPADQWSSYYGLYHPDGVTPLSKEEIPLYRAYTGEKVQGAEMVIAPVNGRKRLLQAYGQPIISSQGEKLGAVIVMRDITELRQSQQQQQAAIMKLKESNKALEAALKELQTAKEQLTAANNELETRVAARTQELVTSEQQMKIITDALPVLISYVDKQLKYRFLNNTFEEWFGFSPSEMIGKTIHEVYGERLDQIMKTAAYAELKKNIQRVFKGERLQFETTLYTKSAGPKPVSINLIPYTVANEVVGFFSLSTDISEHKKVQEQLLKTNQELESILMEAPSPMLILKGENFVYQLVNPAYQRVFPGRQLQGKPLLEALPELKESDIPAILAQVYNTGKTYVIQEMPVLLARHEGAPLEEIYWTFTCQARRNAQGVIDGLFILANEVTDHIKARQQIQVREKEAQTLAEELQARNKELQATNQELRYINTDMDNFIYTASHDLRAPISNIEGLMHAILRSLTPDSRQNPLMEQLFGMVSVSIERFKRTIYDLTEISKIQREGIGEDVTLVDLQEIVKEVQLDLADQIAQAKATFDVALQHCSAVHFSIKNARSIVYNLISNAVKYRSLKRRLQIRISCEQQGDYLVLTVQDNGLGIDLADKSKIFGMFKRLHDHVEGSGVGLYIVKKIIENAGGKIDVDSQLEEGSTFRVYFRQAGRA